MEALQSTDTDFEPETDLEPEPERWCAGLPFLDARPMSPTERDAVATLARRHLRAFSIALAGVAAIISVPFLLGDYHAPNIGAQASIWVSLAAGIGFFISNAVLLLRARDSWRARARLLGDIADGTVFEFSGVVPPAKDIRVDQRPLVDAGVIVPGQSGEQRIAVFAVTNNVIYRDARGHWQALGVRIRAAVAAPAYAMRAPVPRQIAYALDPEKELVKRSLSAAERDEIRHYIHQVKRGSPRLILLIPMLAIWVMLFVSWLRTPYHSVLGMLGPAIGIFFLVRTGRRLVRVFRVTRRISRDLGTGWVFTVRPRPGPEPEVGDVVAPSAPVHEFLPLSGLAWTQNGRPAAWRNLGP
jgi:hypothetical protein